MSGNRLVNIWEIQHYLSFDDEDTWVRVTEDTTADTSRERDTYETAYKDRNVQTTYSLGRTDTFSFVVDALAPGAIQKQFAAHEDEDNVPVTYMRTMAYDFAAQADAPATARVAKKAKALLNCEPIGGDANRPFTFSGEVRMVEDYTAGTFNESTQTFVAENAASGGTQSGS